MKSFTSRRFREQYGNLPNHIQLQARRAGFRSGQELEIKASGGVITILPKLPAAHPSLRAKKYDEAGDLWQARVNYAWPAPPEMNHPAVRRDPLNRMPGLLPDGCPRRDPRLAFRMAPVSAKMR
jgi:hypothetical protein